MKSQKELIREMNWDCLIILDACRYDFFEKTYKDFLDGDLQKIMSVAKGTGEWLEKVFADDYFEDIVYISANPRAASDIKVMNGFMGGEHFHKVVDVWDWGWDANMETVPPEKVTNAAIEARKKYPKKKLLVHYLQPHPPFPELDTSDVRKSSLGKIRHLIDNFGKKHIGRNKLQKIKEAIWRPLLWPLLKRVSSTEKKGGTSEIVERVGEERLRELYENNLRYGLEGVSRLVEQISGKIIISADHGEALGRGGGFGHKKMEIPWLEIESKLDTNLDQLERERVSDQIQKLKENEKI